MYNSNDIANMIKETAKTRNITIKKLLEITGLNYNTMTHMKTSMPKADNLAKIADRLECSVDYLLGRSDEMHNKSNITGNKNVIQQGNVSNSPVTISDILSTPLSEQETELLNIFKSLPPKEKHKVMTFIYEIDDANKKSR